MRKPTSSWLTEGQGAEGIVADRDAVLLRGQRSSACSHTSSGRESGDLEVASLATAGSRAKGQPQGTARSLEKSDEGVVPKKVAKTWVTLVESLEERPEAKGKSAARNTSSTQSEIDVPTTLQRIGQQAKDKPKERLTNLLSHMKAPLLKHAYYALKRKSSAGVDGVLWEEYGVGLNQRLQDLEGRIQRGSYHPQPVRRVFIPKADGRMRPLGVPALEDKIVQQAARMILEPVYEPMFLGFSYGFRPKKSAHDALDALAVAIQKEVNWIIDADIRAYFDTLDHAWMKQFVEHRIGDKRMVRLLMKWMHAGVMESGQFQQVETGTPQGGVISPLLANIYLHYVFDLWAHQWKQKQAHGAVYIVRYADDFVMGFELEADALAMQKAATERFAKFKLELHPDKTRVIEFGKKASGHQESKGLSKPKTFDFLGFTHIASKDRAGRSFQLKRRTSRKKRSAKLAALKEEADRRRHRPVEEQYVWLNQVLRGHYNYYAVPTNFKALNQFHRPLTRTWHQSLQRRSQRGNWTRARQSRFEATFPLLPPKILHPWPSRRFALR